MNKQEYMDCEDKALLHTYNRFPLVLDHGEEYIFMIPMERSILILRQVLQ